MGSESIRGRASFSPRHARRGLALALVPLLVWCAATTARAQTVPRPSEAKQFIVDLAARAQATLDQPQQTLEQREAAFRRLLREGFALDFISRIALGKYWRTASAKDRSTYTDLFGEFVLRTYAPRLGGFRTRQLQVDDAVPKGKRDIVVQTRILQPDGPPIRAGWRIRSFGGHYRIIDIIVEGVSMAINQRYEFAAVVSKNGMAGLLEMLRARTQRLPAEPPA